MNWIIPPYQPPKVAKAKATTEQEDNGAGIIILPPSDAQHNAEMEAYPEDFKQSKA